MVIDALGTAPKGLERRLEEMEIKGRVESIQTTDWPEYWEESWKGEKTCCQPDFNERPSANAGGKNSLGVL